MKYCHGKSSDVYTWYNGAQELPEEWDSTVEPDHYLRRDSLAAHEAGGAPDVRVLYVLVVRGEQIVLQAAFQILTVRDQHINSVSLKRWQHRLWKVFTATIRPRLLVAGQLFRHDISSIYWTDRLTAFEAFSIYRAVIQAAARMTKARAVLVKDCPEALAPLFQNQAPEYLLLRNDISMEMDIEPAWTEMTQYEKTLKHKYAQRYRNIRKRIEGIDIRELAVEDVREQGGEMYRLYMEVTNNQAVRLGILGKDFLPRLKEHYGDKLRMWGFYEEGKLVAFASGFLQKESFDMFYIGFDYKRNSELQLYFNILFFSIEQAIAFEKKHLILGRTALDAKARIGCKPKYLHSFLYIRNAALRNVVARLQSRFSEGAEWEERHPFKA